MNYASIREMDISNGEGIGVALFVQGCRFHCFNCFNTETWDFDGGKEWTEDIKSKFLKLIDKPYINRISLLGGEPLVDENVENILNLVSEIRIAFPDKSIWIYTGYTIEEAIKKNGLTYSDIQLKRLHILKQCDVLVDGRYIDSERDITLKWRGSKNQRVIDLKETFKQKQVVLYCD